MKKTIRIHAAGVAHDYRGSLLPCTVASLGYEMAWTSASKADLVIVGPFGGGERKKHRWLPRGLRPFFERLQAPWSASRGTSTRPLVLFQTGENLRHDHLPCDFALSFDLCVDSPRHFRLPYWWEMVDWSHAGVTGNQNPRFGRLLQLGVLMRPLGLDFMRRPQRAALFASHLRAPRSTLYEQVSRCLPVDGYGPAFQAEIRDHHQSGLEKWALLQNYGFNLCPENSMHPGYYTEKIPEAFAAACLPLTWADANVAVDFNPRALVNLAPMMASGFEPLVELLHSKAALQAYAEEALVLKEPDFSAFQTWLKNVLVEACA